MQIHSVEAISLDGFVDMHDEQRKEESFLDLFSGRFSFFHECVQSRIWRQNFNGRFSRPEKTTVITVIKIVRSPPLKKQPLKLTWTLINS